MHYVTEDQTAKGHKCMFCDQWHDGPCMGVVCSFADELAKTYAPQFAGLLPLQREELLRKVLCKAIHGSHLTDPLVRPLD